MNRHRLRRSAVVVLGAAMLLTATVAETVAPASAHGALESMTPADGAALGEAPERIVLVFASDITDDGTVSIVDDTGVDWSSGDLGTNGTIATQEIRSGMPHGAYEVRWSVTFVDGHPVSDTSRFTVGEAAAAAMSGDPFQLRVGGTGVTVFSIVAVALVAALLLAIVWGAYAAYGRPRHGPSSRDA